MTDYNRPFFNAVANAFLIYRARHGEQGALMFVSELMRRNLGAAYDSMDPKPRKGDPYDFVRVVGERDRSVGLDARFPAVADDRIVYQFWTDPFPQLCGLIRHRVFDATYMDFKVSYLLGDEWFWSTKKHIWDGDDCTEFLIGRKKAVPKLREAEALEVVEAVA